MRLLQLMIAIVLGALVAACGSAVEEGAPAAGSLVDGPVGKQEPEPDDAAPAVLFSQPTATRSPTRRPTTTATPRPRPAPSPTPAPSATPLFETIDLPPLDPNRPADILQEILFYGGGGGGPNDCLDISPTSGGLSWRDRPLDVAFIHPAVGWVDWLDDLLIGTCGWIPGETIALNVYAGNEVIRTEAGVADEYGGWWIKHVFGRNQPPGAYDFLFSGDSGEISHVVDVIGPQEPTAYYLLDEDETDISELLLSGFEPNEAVRIIVYDHDEINAVGRFIGWTTVRIPAGGQLLVRGTSSAHSQIGGYAAIGDRSGEAKRVRAFTNSGLDIEGQSVYVPQAAGDTGSCPGARPTRLSLGMRARVVADRLYVREEPDPNAATVFGTSLSNGRVITITDGPFCGDGLLWWKGETGVITLTNGRQHSITGWMAEESGDEWLLEPVP